MGKEAVMRSVTMTMLLLCLAVPAAFGQDDPGMVEATDAAGRRVFLFDDRTWEPAPPDLRELYWGMSMEQVRQADSVRFIPDDDTLISLNARAFGMTGMMFLEFDQDALVLAGFLFVENYADGEFYIGDYRRLVEHFITRYGEPKEEVVEWRGEETGSLGDAFLRGDVELRTEWETERSHVGCGLVNDDGLFGLLIGYEYKYR